MEGRSRQKSKGLFGRHLSVALLCGSLGILTLASEGAELQKETLKKWDDYIQASSSEMQERLRPDHRFLWVDEMPERNRQVRAGKILVSPVGEPVPKPISSGLIHDWIGAAFIRDAKLEDVLNLVRDYDGYKKVYQPNVADSRLLWTNDLTDKFSAVLVSTEPLARTALDGEYEACYMQVAENKWYGVAYTTRVQEIRDYGHADEQRLPPDVGSGYIWRIYNLERFEERDGGVYIEQEAIALSRDVPISLRWLVDPIVRRVSRNTLLTSLQQTEQAVRSRHGVADPSLAHRLNGGGSVERLSWPIPGVKTPITPPPAPISKRRRGICFERP